MERLTSLFSARTQGLEKIHALEAEHGKLTNEMAALEEKARTNSEKASQVKILICTISSYYLHSIVFNNEGVHFVLFSKAIALLQSDKEKLTEANKALERKLKDTTLQMQGDE